MNETTVSAALHRLADDLTPDTDPLDQVAGARSRHRRQRRNRAGLAALAVATAAVVVGVPAVVGSVSSAPAPGDVAGPGVGTTSVAPPDPTSAQEARAAQQAAEQAEAARQAAADAEEATRQATAAAELADAATPLDQPLTVRAPAGSLGCPDVAGPLSETLGVALQYWQGEQLASDVPCEWGVGEQLLAPIPDRLALQATFLDGATVAQLDAAAAAVPGACVTTAAPTVAPGAVVRRCDATNQVEWSLEVPDTGGVGLLVLSATVGDRYDAVSGPAALAALAALPASSWDSAAG